mgnify:CR=1 FL=1
MMNYLIGILKKCLPVIILLILGAGVGPAQGFDVRLGTSQENGFSQFTGRVMERIFDRHGKGLTLTSVPALNDMHNLTNLQLGALDIALVDSRMLYDAISKSGNFRFMDMDYNSLWMRVPG